MIRHSKTDVDKIWAARHEALKFGVKSDMGWRERITRTTAALRDVWPRESLCFWTEGEERINLAINDVELASAVLTESHILALFRLGWNAHDAREVDHSKFESLIPDAEFSYFYITT